MAETFDCNKVGKLKSTPKHSKDDKNKYVTKLQTQLAEWGYYKKEDIDGDYGPVTAGAVKKFQKKYGLSDDGVFGPEETCPKFNEVINKSTTNTTTTNKDTKKTTITTYDIDCKKIDANNQQYKGNTKNDKTIVQKIQKHLQTLRYYPPENGGQFGEITERALVNFQKKWNTDHTGTGNILHEDGYFDNLTCTALKTAIEDKKKTYDIDCTKIDEDHQQYRKNFENDTKIVSKIQKHLQTLGYFPKDNYGTFGRATEIALINFQKKWNTDHTKESDKITYEGHFDNGTCKALKASIAAYNKKANKQTKNTATAKIETYPANTKKNVIPVKDTNLSIDGIRFKVSKVTPTNHYRSGNWKNIELIQGYKPVKTKHTPLEYTVECYFTNKEFKQLDNELDKIGERICTVVSTVIRSSKYFVEVTVAPQKLTHQKVTMKLTEELTE